MSTNKSLVQKVSGYRVSHEMGRPDKLETQFPSHHLEMQKADWAKYIPNFAFKRC